MAYPVSTADAVRDYLVTQIKALTVWTTPDDYLVCYDVPGPNQPSEIVAVGAHIRQEAQIHSMVGSGQTGFLKEAYRLSIEVRVFQGGEDFKGCWKRAKAIVDAIDTMLRTDPSLGSNVVVAYPASHEWESGWEDSGKGPIVDCLLEVNCEALI